METIYMHLTENTQVNIKYSRTQTRRKCNDVPLGTKVPKWRRDTILLCSSYVLTQIGLEDKNAPANCMKDYYTQSPPHSHPNPQEMVNQSTKGCGMLLH